MGSLAHVGLACVGVAGPPEAGSSAAGAEVRASFDLAGLPAGRAPGDVRAARSSRRRRRDAVREPALSRPRGRAAAGDPDRPGGAARPPAPSAASSAASGGASGGRLHGPGFDACATPSARAMSAWFASPYRALGVYIGGVNRACSQPNLTPSWAPPRSPPAGACSHLRRPPVPDERLGQAAPSWLQSAGIGRARRRPTTPSAAPRASRSVPATRSTSTWRPTRGPRAPPAPPSPFSPPGPRGCTRGYLSGVYSSSASGIADLAGQIGLGYTEPDDIWIANWNGQADTLDPYVPSSAWARHQRLHQFRGGHDETYGGVTINIDTDYVDGATVGAAAPPPPTLPPLTVSHVKATAGTVRLWVRCGWPAGQTCPGQIVMRSQIRVAARARGVRTKVVRVAVFSPAAPSGSREVAPTSSRSVSTPGAAPCWCREGGSGPSCWSRSPAPAPPVRSSSGGVRSWHHYIGFSDAMM